MRTLVIYYSLEGNTKLIAETIAKEAAARKFSFSPAIIFHQAQHVFDGGCQTRHHGATDDAVADVQFDQVRHAVHQRQVLVV